jgi:IclR family KDG regulon transcriptional repressor
MADKQDKRYIVSPAMRVLKVLEFVAEQGHEVTLTMVANELDLPKTSTFRYLRTLVAAGFVNYDVGTDCYGVGNRFRALALTDKSIQTLRECALPALLELHREFNETINLAVLADGRIAYIDIIKSTRALRQRARVGGRDPVHSTALGKAILAHLPEPERTACFADVLVERTSRTITQVRALRRQLRAIAQYGVAIEVSENEEGFMCIGVPVLDEAGYPVAAVSLSAPQRRVTESVQEKAIGQLKAAAARISSELSGSSP